MAEYITHKILSYPPNDSRFIVTRHRDTHFPITRFDSLEQIEARRRELRFNLRMSAGLYPWPERTPLNTRLEHVGDYDGYSVKKIMFESYPGIWSTGNLYLPRPMPTKPAPAILNVIGHWEEQRLHRSDSADYPQQLANFARMGFVALTTDMIGKVDSRQLTHDYGKGECELWLSNGLGVQLWNNIRALDLLTSMPEVDPDNIGVTGASGGGSQTLFLSLVDSRIKAAAPINMISLHMQGGCQCENAPGLRRHTDNVEMCAMLAPRPLFLAGSYGDWTKYLETDELPAVLEAYRHYGAENMVEHFYQIAPHQYNAKTRHKVYSFFARHLMGKELEWEEQPITTDDLNVLRWYPDGGHAPGHASNAEFLAAHKAELADRVSSLDREERLKMLAWITGIRDVSYKSVKLSEKTEEKTRIEGFVLVGEGGEKIPYAVLTPENGDQGRVCLALGDSLADCLADPEVRAMLDSGVTVVSGDLFKTGETADCKLCLSVRGVPSNEIDPNYYTPFNYTPDALRIRDAHALARVAGSLGEKLTAYARGIGARALACALPLLDGKVTAACLETDALLDGADDAAYLEHLNVPGIRLLGGPRGILTLAATPTELF